jgi:hypothetical protein
MENKQMDLQYLTNEEMLEINGGAPWYANPYTALIAGAVYVTKKCIDDWACFKDGLMGNDYNHQ